MKIKNNMKKINSSIVIIGRGPAGMLAALELASHKHDVTLVGRSVKYDDFRTTTLMMPAIGFIDKINIWKKLKKQSAAVKNIRIIDVTDRLIKSPIVVFSAQEIHEDAFGYNIPNAHLNTVLEDSVSNHPLITILEDEVLAYEDDKHYTKIILEKHETLHAQLIIAADGRNSLARKAANITMVDWQYPQTALVLNFSHPHAHNNTSSEFHTIDGPCTQVPLPGNNSSLVYVVNPEKAKYLLELDKAKLARKVEEQIHSILGAVEITSSVQTWPLSGAMPERFANNRIILIGEAAHVFPPIGAQGLNLTVRDIQSLSKAIKNQGSTLNIKSIIEKYNKMRKTDIWLRTRSVHALNLSLLSSTLPLQILRSSGLKILQKSSFIRTFFMREGMCPGDGVKALINGIFSR